MKILHISDLHIGKKVHGFSMLPDQKYILEEVLQFIKKENIHLLLIAGDIYDQSIPSEAAIQLLDWFLNHLAAEKVKVCIISGNHDSNIRLGFGSNLLQSQNIFIESVYTGKVVCHSFEDVDVYMVPFVKPALVQPYFEDEKIDSYQKMMEKILSTITLDASKTNILMVHQFITGAKICESEESNVGGLDQISAETFKNFDYVALGHLHSPQTMGKNIWYCGTLLKYSVDEIFQNKSMLLLNTKGHEVTVEKIPLHPQRDFIEIRGNYMELTDRKYYEKLDTKSYIHVVLQDENDVPNAFARLQSIYPNIVKLSYDNARTQKESEIETIDKIEQRNPLDLIEKFYEMQNNSKMNERQKRIVENLWEETI